MLRPGRAARVPIDDASWSRLLARSALFQRLDSDHRERLRDACGHFLGRKSFTAAAGHVIDDDQCLAIAALACLPILALGIDWLDGWREVIVYPGGFRVRREHHDEHSGVVTEGDDELIGEAWERGPVVLSWADVAADLDHPFEGLNVVIHEIAHKLDMRDGAMNGVPGLPDRIARSEWIATMQAAYDELVRRVDAGEETAIDPYAAEAPDEFFAVISETWFSYATIVHDEMPAVAKLLQRFYAGSALEG
ncbi:MAG: zinc-dependent peptidase [Xanthomonadales bacterium]|nr:zinc-dependent peptidase [Xanthomonadales bacterium]